MSLSVIHFLQGLTLCFSLIISIGIQNSFVLKQGILRNHNVIVGIICASGDAILIIAGVYGFGAILDKSQLLLEIFFWGGILFLFAYGILAFLSSFKNHKLNINNQQKILSLKEVVTTTFIVTFLNPAAYLDTCVLIGGVSARLEGGDKFSFALGAIIASITWFMLLSFLSRYLKPLFEKPTSWKVLDFIIGCIMFAIAISLIIKHQ